MEKLLSAAVINIARIRHIMLGEGEVPLCHACVMFALSVCMIRRDPTQLLEKVATAA